MKSHTYNILCYKWEGKRKKTKKQFDQDFLIYITQLYTKESVSCLIQKNGKSLLFTHNDSLNY